MVVLKRMACHIAHPIIKRIASLQGIEIREVKKYLHPYQYNKIYIIDKIQRRAARWSLCNYDRYSSVTLMQHQLDGKTFNNVEKLLDYYYYISFI